MSDDEQKTTPIRRTARPDRRLHPAARRGTQGARDLAAAQNEASREAYEAAARQQRDEKLLRVGRVVPARITMALDMRGLDGPEVDEACGTFERNPAGDVDMWEMALAVPSPEQVRLLAELTGFPIPFFYKPVKPGPQLGPLWISWGGRRGCQLVQPDVVTEQGVLLYEGKPRELDPFVQGQLPGMPAPTAKQRPPSSREPAPKKSKPAAAVTQPPLRTGMPAHLREELMQTLKARKGT